MQKNGAAGKGGSTVKDLTNGAPFRLILGFAVLEFLRRCGFKEVKADIPYAYATRLGFRKAGDGLILDLTAGRACGGH